MPLCLCLYLSVCIYLSVSECLPLSVCLSLSLSVTVCLFLSVFVSLSLLLWSSLCIPPFIPPCFSLSLCLLPSFRLAFYFCFFHLPSLIHAPSLFLSLNLTPFLPHNLSLHPFLPPSPPSLHFYLPLSFSLSPPLSLPLCLSVSLSVSLSLSLLISLCVSFLFANYSYCKASRLFTASFYPKSRMRHRFAKNFHIFSKKQKITTTPSKVMSYLDTTHTGCLLPALRCHSETCSMQVSRDSDHWLRPVPSLRGLWPEDVLMRRLLRESSWSSLSDPPS